MAANKANLLLKRDDEKMNDCAPPLNGDVGSNQSKLQRSGSNRSPVKNPRPVLQIASTEVNTALNWLRGAMR